MSARSPDPGRDERLAAKLRENLRRRKTQARALSIGETAGDDTPDPAGDSHPALPEGNGLSKTPPKS